MKKLTTPAAAEVAAQVIRNPELFRLIMMFKRRLPNLVLEFERSNIDEWFDVLEPPDEYPALGMLPKLAIWKSNFRVFRTLISLQQFPYYRRDPTLNFGDVRRFAAVNDRLDALEYLHLHAEDGPSFFYGGSRGNPGPGGSGSVVIETDQDGSYTKVLWAAATALGSTSTTNNVAEFVGLHRLLTQATERGWTGLQVVGDSAMILRMMETRTPPKAKSLQHWYKTTRKLADLCRVGKWNHHYRRFNKMADWLANRAMDAKRSEMVDFAEVHMRQGMLEGLEMRVGGDMQRWIEQREIG